MRNTNRLFGALDSLELPTQLVSDQMLTAEPIKTNQFGLSVAASLFVSKPYSDVIVSNTIQVGDIISFTSGVLSGLQIKVKIVDVLVDTLVNDLPASPSPGDTVDILRYTYPLISSTGILTVTANQGTSPWVISGTVTANLGTIDGVATSANQSTEINLLTTRLSGSLVPTAYDEIDLTYVPSGNGAGQIATVLYKLATVLVATLTLSYDGSNNLISVVKS